MVDPRGGALTLGLGLVGQLAVLPHYDTWSEEKAHRTVQLATGHLRIAAVDERTALIRDPDGSLARRAGAGAVTVTSTASRRAGRPGRPGRPARSTAARATAPEPAAARQAAGPVGQSASVMVTDSMVTVSLGVPDLVPMASMAATTSRPATTLPNSEYCGGSRDPRRPADDEELAAVGVGTGVGHGQRPDLVAARRGQLVGEPVAGAAPAGARSGPRPGRRSRG